MTPLGKIWTIRGTLVTRWTLIVMVCLGGGRLSGSISAKRGTLGVPRKVVLELVEKADKLLINYHDDTTAVITDPESLAKLNAIIHQATFSPSRYCFCINSPEFVVFAGESELFRLTIPHGVKFRFSGRALNGDVEVDQVFADALVALAKEKKVLAVKQAHARLPTPATSPKIPIQP